MQPVTKSIKDRFQQLSLSDDIFKQGVIITADTGFANEANMKYLQENEIDGYIPDNQFRSRDPKFQNQKINHKKPGTPKRSKPDKIPASAFEFDPVKLTCRRPAGEWLSFKVKSNDEHGNLKAFFRGRATQCRRCHLKKSCMEIHVLPTTPKTAEDARFHSSWQNVGSRIILIG